MSGRIQSDEPGAESESFQLPIPCHTCGAAMRPGAAIDEQIPMFCAYCGATEWLPAELNERAAALRRRLTDLKWAREELQGPEAWFARQIEQPSDQWRSWVGFIIVSGICSTLMGQNLRMLIPWALSLLCLGAPCVITWYRYRRHIRPLLMARVPIEHGGPTRCRCCGGNLPDSSEPFLSCPYCRAQNLMTAATAAEHKALLAREAEEYRRRAEGAGEVLYRHRMFSLKLVYAGILLANVAFVLGAEYVGR